MKIKILAFLFCLALGVVGAIQYKELTCYRLDGECIEIEEIDVASTETVVIEDNTFYVPVCEKAKIVKIGTVTKDEFGGWVIKGWAFEGGCSPYTLDELREIAAKNKP